ncbi:MAG: response regulator [Magnetococcales bacterium]|nr:response regulator [Magnetococcales bacterium]MBF0322951.1 response regulator [Magnetococcales bacterium]
MKILIADDEANNRILLENFLSPYGSCDSVVNGLAAVETFEMAVRDGAPYDLVCLDIMMPELDGQKALVRIRKLESELRSDGREAAIFMITALDVEEHMLRAFLIGGCTDYLIKPITSRKVVEKLRQHRIIPV